MNRYSKNFLLIITVGFVAFFYCGGCSGGSGESEISNASNNEDEVVSQEDVIVPTESLKGLIQRDTISIDIYDDIVVISDGYNSLVGAKSATDGTFKIRSEHRGYTALCNLLPDISSTADFTCEIDGEACTYTLKLVDGNKYIENSNTCKNIIYSSTVSKSVVVKSENNLKSDLGNEDGLWSGECNAYINDSTPLCPRIVSRESSNYYYKSACANDPPEQKSDVEIIASTGAGIDEENKNTLQITMVSSESNHEGNFWMWGNGPFGNIHILLIPYDPALLENGSLENFNRIRLAESGGNGTTLIDNNSSYILWPDFLPGPYNDIPKAPISSHQILRGAYLSNNGQCEWYDEEVGKQTVLYDEKIVWDWDNFCACDECPPKLIFAIWESDEGFLDDAIMYGVVDFNDTIGKTAIFTNDNFTITFKTKNIDQQSLNENLLNSTGKLYECATKGIGSSYGIINGILEKDGETYSPSDAKQVLFYVDDFIDPQEVQIFFRLNHPVIDCTTESAYWSNFYSEESLRLILKKRDLPPLDPLDELYGFPEDDFVGSDFVGYYDSFNAQLFNTKLASLASPWVRSLNKEKGWGVGIDSMLIRVKANLSNFRPFVEGYFNAGFYSDTVVVDNNFTKYNGTLGGSFYSQNYCGEIPQ